MPDLWGEQGVLGLVLVPCGGGACKSGHLGGEIGGVLGSLRVLDMDFRRVELCTFLVDHADEFLSFR